ncbi:hypothetical protein GCM10023083_01100 [Streptomyces phyllanthi]
MGLRTPAPEALVVVRAEQLAGGGRVGVPYGHHGVGRRLQGCGTTTHSRRPYPPARHPPPPYLTALRADRPDPPVTHHRPTRRRFAPTAPIPASVRHRAKLGGMQPSASPYEERLSAPRTWWLICALVGVAMALILLPFGTLPLLGGLVGGTAAAAVVASSYGSVRIRVVGGALIAGEAKIPVAALGDAEVLDPEEARAWRSHKADPRAFMLLRAYIPTAVRIPVTDPDDPTPYLYLSTREPRSLVTALETARATA